jgi:hypothetical protein
MAAVIASDGFLVIISVSLSRSQSHRAAGRIGSIEKSIDFIGILTSGFPAYSLVLKRTALQRTDRNRGDKKPNNSNFRVFISYVGVDMFLKYF